MSYNSDKNYYDLSWSTNTTAMMDALKTRVSYSDTEKISSTGTVITNAKDTDLNRVKHLLNSGNILMVRVKSEGLTNWSYKNRYGTTNESVAYRASNAKYGHAMTIVGYDDTVNCDVNGNGSIEPFERGAFKVTNSWGTGWKNGGYVWVLYDALNKVSANTTNNWESNLSGTRIPIFERSENSPDNCFYYIEVENYDVGLAGTLTVNTTNRNKLSVDLFRNGDNSLLYTDLNSIRYLYGPSKSSSAINTAKSFNGTLVFDYGDFDNPLSICTNGYYFGVGVNNHLTSANTSFSNMSYKIVDNKLNVVKDLGLSSTLTNGNSAKKSARIVCQKGDVNYDGSVNMEDSNIVLNYVAMFIKLSNLQYYLADFNNDGTVNIADVLAIRSILSLSGNVSKSELNALDQRIQEYYVNEVGVDYVEN